MQRKANPLQIRIQTWPKERLNDLNSDVTELGIKIGHAHAHGKWVENINK